MGYPPQGLWGGGAVTITEHHYAFRMDRESFAIWDGDYGGWCCRSKNALYSISSILLTKPQYGFGTYRCYGKILLNGTPSVLYVMGFERHHGFFEEGIIGFFRGTNYYNVVTAWDGTYTITSLTGQDWTIEREFKIVWTSTQVDFYVDGSLVASHTTDIPQSELSWFIESSTPTTELPGGEIGVWQRNFEKIE